MSEPGVAAGERDGAPWADALAAARLLAHDPAGLGGVVVRAAAGPVRDRWFEYFRGRLDAAAAVRRLPLHASDEDIIGGLDLAATLAAGRPVARRGLLAEADGGIVVMAMAERADGKTAAHIAAALDTGEVVVERDGVRLRAPARFAVVALDEGASDDEAAPAMIAERCAFRIDLTSVSIREAAADDLPVPDGAPAEDTIAALCAAALAFGIDSARAALLALRAARASAALRGGIAPTADDLNLAGRLVLAHRATRLPSDASGPPPAGESPPGDADEQSGDTAAPTDMLVEAVRAALPPGILAAFASGGSGRSAASPGRGGGRGSMSRTSGRPAGVRRGVPARGARLSILDTLRAAAPLQRLRRTEHPERAGIIVGASDLRIRRFVQPKRSTTIFVVDASGSAALERLAEAKGAVELLLANAHVRRAEVALIAFRGTSAEVVLPPTRSLVRAKRSLAGLAGGGGTPLAAGIEAGCRLAESAAGKGRTPHLVVMTDGRANVTRAGTAGRAAAQAEAIAAARQVGAARYGAVVVDIGARPRREAADVADAMNALYAALPGGEPGAVVDAVTRAGDAAR